MSQVAKRTVSDDLLIKHARKSPREIEELTGIPANEALARLNELLDSRDHLTPRREEMLILAEMENLIRDAQERMRHAADRDFASIANVVQRAFGQLQTRIENARRNMKVDMSRISVGQAKVFGRIFDVMLGYMLDELRAEYDIPEERILTLHREAMEHAQDWADKNVVEADE